MIRILKITWALAMLGLALYLLTGTPEAMQRDAERNRHRFEDPVQYISDFQNRYHRLPTGREFGGGQYPIINQFPDSISEGCKAIGYTDRSGNNGFQYFRSNGDIIGFSGQELLPEKEDWCQNYVLARWTGEEWVYYLSWDTGYSNAESWEASLMGAFVYLCFGGVPFLFGRKKDSSLDKPVYA